ncbi:MAG: hypothetical protein HDQ88_09775 [Clostridia bacterium]|nr:hypothetical protein [Clostridia bacterium]
MTRKEKEYKFWRMQKVVITKECEYKGWIGEIQDRFIDDRGPIYEILVGPETNRYREEDIQLWERPDRYDDYQTMSQKQRWESLSPWERQMKRRLYEICHDNYLRELLIGAYGYHVANSPQLKVGDRVLILTGEYAGLEDVIDRIGIYYEPDTASIKGKIYRFCQLELIKPEQ